MAPAGGAGRGGDRDRSSHSKIPPYVVFVEDDPMTASGRIQKFKLREMSAALFADRI